LLRRTAFLECRRTATVRRQSYLFKELNRFRPSEPWIAMFA
jgi:hypothetical protein